MKRCHLCGHAGPLVTHSFDSLDGRGLEVRNCDDAEACYERCHRNALAVAKVSKRKPRRGS